MKLPFLFIAAMYALMPASVTISVYPQFSLSPATFRVLVLVPRHGDNRSLCISYALSADPFVPIRRSCQSLAGEQERRTRTLYWDIREAGEYEAVAVLTRITEGQTQTYRSQQHFQVLGMEP